MVVADERMVKSGFAYLCLAKRCVRLLSFAFKGQPAELRPMEQCNVYPGAVDVETFEKAICIRRSAVAGSPQRESTIELYRLEAIFAKDVHILWPSLSGIQGVRCEPVVITGREIDTPRRQLGKQVPKEGGGIRCEQIVLVEVTSAEQRVSTLVDDQRCDPFEDTTLCVAAFTSNIATNAHPSEGRVEVEVREMHDLHGCPVAVSSDGALRRRSRRPRGVAYRVSWDSAATSLDARVNPRPSTWSATRVR
jgi:hypothetical protein